MDVLCYNELDISDVQKQYEKTVDQIKRNDFYSAEVKKLTGTPYYRAKLDQTNRLLFKVVSYAGKTYALLLEIIANHAYEKSRFLNGAHVDDGKINDAILNAHFEQEPPDKIPYLNPENSQFHILNKIISFDPLQHDIFQLNPPVIIIGSAGSGKTMLTLEKMKPWVGNILYVTGSPYLVQNARNLYYANHYTNDEQEIDFLSYQELLQTIQVPQGKEIDFYVFSAWLRNIPKNKAFQDAHKLYEEFKGVLTGNSLHKKYLPREEYIDLGVKQSIYAIEERPQLYSLFEKYIAFLSDKKHYDINLTSFDYLSHCEAQYDLVVVDEVQDFTPIQIALILKTLRHPNQFFLCGDSNQIVHPNFFSWAKIKTLFYKESSLSSMELIRILNKNYRNAPAVTAIANQILKIKTARFGSIDRESHYLVESTSTTEGKIYCLRDSPLIRQEINQKTRKSTHFAILVLRDEEKPMVSQYFQTPLVFSIHEAKGLEYDNVILYNFITSEEKRFREITENITPEDLESEFNYSRTKNKTDRSLEIYKFYINALYVAITRAIQHVYCIENLEHHPLLDLLGFKPSETLVAIDAKESSLDEWQQEAQRLELQGKQEQANAIRNTILHQQKPPWQIITPNVLNTLCQKALNKDKRDKEARLLLFEYALLHQQRELLIALEQIGFVPSFKQGKSLDLLEKKYFMGYFATNPTGVLRQTDLYGVDFRNIFNQTPLLLACKFGNIPLVQKLIEKGSNPHLTDNQGRNAFQIALQSALCDKKFAQTKLAPLCQHLIPVSIDLQVENRLIKIGPERMEFFLLNAMIALVHHHVSVRFGLKVDDFLMPLAHFPEIVMPEKRKRRQYISSILAKNEINRRDAYNRKLFLRIRHGHYTLNPDLMVKINEEWVDLYTLLHLEDLRKTILERPLVPV